MWVQRGARSHLFWSLVEPVWVNPGAGGKPYADKHHPGVLAPPLVSGWGTRPDGPVGMHPQTPKPLHQWEGWRPAESHPLLRVRAPHV